MSIESISPSVNDFKNVAIIRFIKPEYEEEFIEMYEKEFKIRNKVGLGWEVLFRMMEGAEVPFESRDLASDHENFLVYINIGCWQNLDYFAEEVSPMMTDQEYYEFKPRLRMGLDPVAVRLGLFQPKFGATCE